MPWYVDDLAGPLGYKHCVLFDCARDAIAAYHNVTETPLVLPENICPELVAHMKKEGHEVILGQINQATGLANNGVHLYGYQARSEGPAELALDPLMTGWVRHLKARSAVVSFGKKKMLSIGYGGALLTHDNGLADELGFKYGNWNGAYNGPLIGALNGFCGHIDRRWEIVDLWDRYLGDSLVRVPQEQLMPWRVMRRAHYKGERDVIVSELRMAGIAVGTNYGPLTGRNDWGDTVLNFSCTPDTAEKTGSIWRACEIIKRVAYNG